MSHTPTAPSEPTQHRGLASGLALFGGVILILGGAFQAAQGLSAIREDNLYGAVDDFVYQTDLSVWGWVHVVIGVLGILIGAAIIAKKRWAYGFGILIASMSAFANFLSLPNYPVWAIVIIALDIAVLWALSTLFDS